MARSKFIVRRTTRGISSTSCSYLVDRPVASTRTPKKDRFRFAKIATNNATSFGTRKEAEKTLTLMRRYDTLREESSYEVIRA